MTLPVFAAASMAVNRCHRGAMGIVCVGRVVRCSDMRVSPQSPQHDDDFFSVASVEEKKDRTQSTRVSTKHTAVSSMLHLHSANPPPHDFAGLRRGLASAWPRQKGLPFVRDSYNGVVCAYEA